MPHSVLCPDWLSPGCGLLFRWQALAGALVTLAAGVLAYLAVRSQTKAHEKEARDRKLRLARSFRAVMPDDLASVGLYAQECARLQILILKRITNENSGQRLDSRPTIKMPELPERTLDDLRQLIESLDEADSSKLADLAGAYQVQHSRLIGLARDFNEPNRHGIENIVTEHHVVDVTLMPTVELQLRANQMLPFARRQCDHIPTPQCTEENFRGAIRHLELDPVLTDVQQARLRKALVNKFE